MYKIKLRMGDMTLRRFLMIPRDMFLRGHLSITRSIYILGSGKGIADGHKDALLQLC